jgi:hypothetical protein
VFEWLYQYLPPGGTEKAHDDFMPIGLWARFEPHTSRIWGRIA